MKSYNNVIKNEKKFEVKMKRTKRKNPKYSSYNKKTKSWMIKRKIKGKQVYFGSYKTREECEKAVEIYNKIGWDPVKNWHVRAKVREELYGG